MPGTEALGRSLSGKSKKKKRKRKEANKHKRKNIDIDILECNTFHPTKGCEKLFTVVLV